MFVTINLKDFVITIGLSSSSSFSFFLAPGRGACLENFQVEIEVLPTPNLLLGLDAGHDCFILNSVGHLEF